jgi:hypothetical protein
MRAYFLPATCKWACFIPGENVCFRFEGEAFERKAAVSANEQHLGE